MVKLFFGLLKKHKKGLSCSVIILLLSGVITSVDVRLSALEDQIADTIHRNDWIAYINRKDGEYHIQQAINNTLFGKMGLIEGKLGEDDTEINSLLAHDLKETPGQYVAAIK